MRLVRRLAPLLGAALVVAACGEPVAPLGMTELRGTVYDPPGAVEPAQVLAVALLVVDAAEADILTPAGFAEIDPGAHLGLATTVADDGGFTIRLPAEDGLPDGVLVAAADAVWDVTEAGCTLAANPPAARVSQTGISLLPVPALFGFTESGLALLVTSPVALEDGVPYEGGYLSWMYADTPVALATDDACVGVDVELELRRGWNQVVWTPGAPVTLRGAADEDVLSSAIFF